MKIKTDKTGSQAALEELLKAAEADADIQTILVLACDANPFSKKTLDPVLKNITKPIFGGIFPAIMHDSEKLNVGTIVAGLYSPADIHIIHNMSDMQENYEKVLDEKIPEAPSKKTVFIIVDGLSKRINSLIDSLFHIFGLEMNYIGGGAGSLSFTQKEVLLTNQGLIQDAAILAMTDIDSGIGVSHGWEVVEGPFKVTASDRTVIKTLDCRPAFQVYQQVVKNYSGKNINKDNFFDIAKGFPFGISKLGSEKIVRDPLWLTPDGHLICVGEVPQDSFIYILKGNTESLVNAAKEALLNGMNSFRKEGEHKVTFFIDCISRALFLDKEFEREQKAVIDRSIPLIGALTLGEIANCGKDYLEFYNKTAVIGVLGD